ncbi:MAG TPA: aminodeoxychorismate lyase [Steroidobacteraceae bacterium]|nr:aminodeoxychorismate lyase [Steroidobacteraceae bacterium]
MSVWINGRRCSTLGSRNRGLQYGDGIFETMRVLRRRIRLLDFHLERLHAGCRRLGIESPPEVALQCELERIAARRSEGIVKLIVTRGGGVRGYRPSGRERSVRIITLHSLPRSVAGGEAGVRVRLCATPLSVNRRLAGIKTLNRLDSVLARAEWHDARIWEGLMSDAAGNWVCGTMSNLFLRRGAWLTTPLLDRCGVAGVMRRWVLETAAGQGLRVSQRRVRWDDFESAEEVFMSNAVVGIRSVRALEHAPADTVRFSCTDAADRLRRLLERQ